MRMLLLLAALVGAPDVAEARDPAVASCEWDVQVRILGSASAYTPVAHLIAGERVMLRYTAGSGEREHECTFVMNEGQYVFAPYLARDGCDDPVASGKSPDQCTAEMVEAVRVRAELSRQRAYLRDTGVYPFDPADTELSSD